MGQGHRKAMAAGFTQCTAKTLAADLGQPELPFSNQLSELLLIECERQPEDAVVDIGDSVRLVDLRDAIDVFCGSRRIGIVIEHQIAILRELYLLPLRQGRSIKGVVQEVSALSSIFLVIVTDEK